jgi:DNA-binding transcriptional regulator GbsR (MarR family)
MKTITACVALLLISISTQVQAQTDREQVYTAIEDYVEALYQVQPERIKKSVHPNLTKKGFWKGTGKDAYGQEQTMTYQQLYDLAAKWNSKGNAITKDSPKTIEIYDVQDQTASGKLTAEWGTDYFQLAKYDGKWLIVNIVWQGPRKKPTP